jgi:hypothetical protein
MRTYEPTYWNHKGKHQAMYEDLRSRLVPDEGKASTTAGELVRMVANIYHDHFNNGGGNLISGGRSRDVSGLLYLVPNEMLAEAQVFCTPFDLDDEARIKQIDNFVDWAIAYAYAIEKALLPAA